MDTDRHDSAHTQLQETMFFDQDSYARGFVDALQLCHAIVLDYRPQIERTGVNGSGLPHYPPSFSFFSHDDQDCSFEYGQSQAMDSDSDDDTNSNLSMSSSASSSRRSRRTPVSEEDRQEEKRKRNRDAAARCRAKKLDNIATLSDRVKDLKEENCHLVNTVTALRDDVAKIKQQILEHATDGCLKLAPNGM
nr:hypothetical protein BaRGS_031960 [Batillaria attramentaria]